MQMAVGWQASEAYYNYIVECEDVFMEEFAITAHHQNVVANIVHPSLGSHERKGDIYSQYISSRIT